MEGRDRREVVDAHAVAHPHLVPEVHERNTYEAIVKPVFDIVLGILVTIVTLPLVVIIGVLILWKLGTPVVFEQTRVGRFGKPFTVYKFRTMQADRRNTEVPILHDDRRVNHKSDKDPRHTDLGRILRKWSLDEIPQFWNVALGQMSIVGPRPELPSIVAGYEPWQHRRHEVKPGLTGLWQVSARGLAPMHEATDIDIDYVENVSLVTDVKILLATPRAVLRSQQGQ